jgi:hypothetical protein
MVPEPSPKEPAVRAPFVADGSVGEPGAQPATAIVRTTDMRRRASPFTRGSISANGEARSVSPRILYQQGPLTPALLHVTIWLSNPPVR